MLIYVSDRVSTTVENGLKKLHFLIGVDIVDYHKYYSNTKSLNGIRRASDRLCREAGLSVIAPGKAGVKAPSNTVTRTEGGAPARQKVKARPIQVTAPTRIRVVTRAAYARPSTPPFRT